MSVDETKVGEMRAVAIAREYGSGGGEIARRLAAHLRWQLLDHEIVARLAAHMGLSEHDAADLDEHGNGFWGRLLSRMEYTTTDGTGLQPLLEPEDATQDYQRAVRRLLLDAAQAGQVVIVGRGGPLALADRRDVLRVKIVAPLPVRVRYVMRREGLSEQQARERIKQKEQERRRALQEEYSGLGDQEHLYDLLINTAVLPLDSGVRLILLALQDKSRQLGLPNSALGPDAGLARYPAQPTDAAIAKPERS